MKPKATFPLIAALLALLLAPLSGVAADRQAQIADLVRAMGYGGAVHQFKNYVLRGADKHATAASAGFAKAQETVTALQAGADAGQADALKGIAGTIAQYQAALPTIKALQADGKSVKEVDAAVKIDDKPAVEGLKALRAPYNWGALEQAEYALGYGNAIHQFKNYVIRGADKHSTAAAERFNEAKTALNKLNAQNAAAVTQVVGVIDAYAAALPKIQGMVAEGKAPTEIDQAVKIDDKPAIEGLAALRGK